MIKNITKNEHDYELLRKEAIDKFNGSQKKVSLILHLGLVDWILNSPSDFSPNTPPEKIVSSRSYQSELVHALANLIVH
jgi:hypothetical protein